MSIVRITLAATSMAFFWAVLAPTTSDAETLFLEPSPGAATARLLFLPEDRARLDADATDGEARITVTGAYSSGDAFRPEGFTIRAGDPTRPYPQGWDGLLTIDALGRARIHNIADVEIDGRRFDLRDSAARDAFVALAESDGLSAVQSHLLITDGRLDVRPAENGRRFRRRILFQLADGRIGLFDTRPDALTLYEAALAVEAAHGPVMALNLDMGAYDFCELRTTDGRENCGLLTRTGVDDRLTNLLELSLADP